jgi:hypothetical protein
VTCDASAGLYPSADYSGCVQVVHLQTVAEDWQTFALYVLVLVLVALGALVVSQLRKG